MNCWRRRHDFNNYGSYFGYFRISWFRCRDGRLAPDPIASLIVYLIFLLMGIGLILWGIQRRKNKHIKVNQPSTSINDPSTSINDPYIFDNKKENQSFQHSIALPGVVYPGNNESKTLIIEEISLLIFEWKSKWMLFDFPMHIYVDDMLTGIIFFKEDSRFVVPVTQGNHKVKVTMSFRTADLMISTYGNQLFQINIEYSRAAGSVKLESSYMSDSITKDYIISCINTFNSRKRFMNEIYNFTPKGYTITALSLADTSACLKLTKYSYNANLIIFFILGLLPGLIYIIVSEATSKKMIFEQSSNGAITVR